MCEISRVPVTDQIQSVAITIHKYNKSTFFGPPFVLLLSTFIFICHPLSLFSSYSLHQLLAILDSFLRSIPRFIRICICLKLWLRSLCKYFWHCQLVLVPFPSFLPIWSCFLRILSNVVFFTLLPADGGSDCRRRYKFWKKKKRCWTERLSFTKNEGIIENASHLDLNTPLRRRKHLRKCESVSERTAVRFLQVSSVAAH